MTHCEKCKYAHTEPCACPCHKPTHPDTKSTHLEGNLPNTPMNIKDLEEFEKRFVKCFESDPDDAGLIKNDRLVGMEDLWTELRTWIIQDRINTIKQVLEMIDGVIDETRFDTSTKYGFIVYRQELKSKLNKLIE